MEFTGFKNFTITKRDGSIELFSLDKIMNAIIKAFNSVDETIDLEGMSKILGHLDLHDGIKVEDVALNPVTCLHKYKARQGNVYRQGNFRFCKIKDKILLPLQGFKISIRKIGGCRHVFRMAR